MGEREFSYGHAELEVSVLHGGEGVLHTVKNVIIEPNVNWYSHVSIAAFQIHEMISHWE